MRLIFGMDLRTWTQTLGQQSKWIPAVDHKTIFPYSDILTSGRHNKAALREPAGLNSHYGDANGGAEENRQPRVRINHIGNSLNGFPVVGPMRFHRELASSILPNSINQLDKSKSIVDITKCDTLYFPSPNSNHGRINSNIDISYINNK